MAQVRFVPLWNEVWDVAHRTPRPDVTGLISEPFPICECGGSPMTHDFTQRKAPGTSLRDPCDGFQLVLVRFERREYIEIPVEHPEGAG